ncbi:hypothetical protein [Corallococcus aberystwythensis]|uniref:Uncharacterized protein n=1 Tax=Corallococcus aberystwythensis TaxID=2316722 RepID=A0A3A8PEF4_9BACT|nr:hypothetical protein [Corallococcus aberystwythensis]RKH54766.1 hypothetical protein D7W81_37730 [Corallococcus aberystwythensis]
MWGNAFLLSVLYLLAGIVVETLRRRYPKYFFDRLSMALDSLPARALELVHAMEPLRAAYFSGRITDLGVRVVFGVVTVAVIFLLALVVGAIMAVLRWGLMRATRGGNRPPPGEG